MDFLKLFIIVIDMFFVIGTLFMGITEKEDRAISLLISVVFFVNAYCLW